MTISLPYGYEPCESEEYMNSMQLEYFKIKLLAWQEQLLKDSDQTLHHLKEESWNEPDIADRASVEMEASFELRTRDRYRKLINKISDAIKRIESGEYGFCAATGEKIGLQRLKARPIAIFCVQVQEQHERNEKSYANNDDDDNTNFM